MTGPPSEVVLGERAQAQAALVLEQQLGATWVVVLEAVGADPEAGWSLVVDGLRLVKTGPRAAPGGGNGQAPGGSQIARPPLETSPG
jgi:hypothetical protein